MPTQIEQDMNKAVDRQMQRHHEPTEWDQILGIILAEFENERDDYVVTICGKAIVSRQSQFVNKMELTLLELRRMHKELRGTR